MKTLQWWKIWRILPCHKKLLMWTSAKMKLQLENKSHNWIFLAVLDPITIIFISVILCLEVRKKNRDQISWLSIIKSTSCEG